MGGSTINHFFVTSLMNSIIQVHEYVRFELSYYYVWGTPVV